jgi:hypothetical protein
MVAKIHLRLLEMKHRQEHARLFSSYDRDMQRLLKAKHLANKVGADLATIEDLNERLSRVSNNRWDALEMMAKRHAEEREELVRTLVAKVAP